LSARVADGIADRQPCNPDCELLGQGLANVASGVVGGVLATEAIAHASTHVLATRAAYQTAAQVRARHCAQVEFHSRRQVLGKRKPPSDAGAELCSQYVSPADGGLR
jgi:hypothetical protein